MRNARVTRVKQIAAFGAAAVVGSAAWLIAGPAPGGPADGVGQEAEGFEWFWAINGPVSADGANQMSVDAEGNVFIAGDHSGLDFDRDNVVDLESGGTSYVGARNPFFMKLNRGPSDDRVRMRWTRSPRTPADRSSTRIAADGRGGAYIKGHFAESLSFEGGPNLQGAGSNDAYIARYDGDGNVMWARVFGGAEDGDAIYGLAVDRDANAYIVATGTGPFRLDVRGAEFPGTGGRAPGLVSYDPDGVVRWMRVFAPGASTPRAVPPVLPFNVVLAPSGEVFVFGQFEVAVDFDGDGEPDLSAPRDRDGFVARFDTDGEFLGAWTVGVPGSPTFDAGGDLFLGSMVGPPVEQMFGPADFDGDGRADVEPRGGHPTGAVVARFSPLGELRWVRSYALENPADLEVKDGRIALSGNYHGMRDLDEDGVPETRLDEPEFVDTETDLAILILSAEDGTPERVWTAPGPGNDWANAVAFSPSEPVLYVAGSIQVTADFTGNGERDEGWVECDNSGDVFFAQYRLAKPLVEVTPERRERSERERPERERTEREPTERERTEREPVEIVLEVVLTGGEREPAARLTWSGARAERVDIYRNDRLIATTRNDGTHTDVLSDEGPAPPYRYRVCVADTTRCSGTVEARRE